MNDKTKSHSAKVSSSTASQSAQSSETGHTQYKDYILPAERTNPTATAASAISESEKESRREAMIRAAQEREKSWSKKVISGRNRNKVFYIIKTI